MTSFEELGVSAPLLRALDALEFTNPTDIQAATIPPIMDGNDVIGVAQTGSGKTAAFVIPVIERMALHKKKAEPGMPRALILAPTRELAIQITEKIKELSIQMKVSCCTVYGGAPYKTQTHILKRGVDILIATPGRLKDHMKQGNIWLDMVEYFVLDEADRMLDMGFVDEVRELSKKLPKGHQSVMFSATLNPDIKSLAGTLLTDPVHIEMARQSTITDNLDHSVMMVPGHKKNDLLLHLIEEYNPDKTLVFVRTRRNADELCQYLKATGYSADSIHGDKKQKERQRTIRNFSDGRFDFLVATDVAARGIDVKDITHVFNMDVPVEPESYVHRIGRTARGSAHGKAVTLCGKNDMRLLKAIEALIAMTIPVDSDHPFPLLDNKPRKPARPVKEKHRKTRKDRTPIGKRSRQAKGEGRTQADRDGRPPKKGVDSRYAKPAKRSRPQKDERPRKNTNTGGRPERTEKSETFARAEKATGQGNRKRTERPSRPTRSEGADRKERPVRAEKPGRSEKPAKQKSGNKKRPAVAARKAAAKKTNEMRKKSATTPKSSNKGRPARSGPKAGGNKPLMRKR